MYMYMCITNERMKSVSIPDNLKKDETQSASDVLVTFFCCYIYRQMCCHTTVISPMTVESTSTDVVWNPMRPSMIIHEDILELMHISASSTMFHGWTDQMPCIHRVYSTFCCIYEICSSCLCQVSPFFFKRHQLQKCTVFVI